jgi:hypothetical protein
MFCRTSGSLRHLIILPVAASVPALFACGGGAGDEQAAATVACTVPMDSIIGYSLDRWIRTRVPQPYRFMIPLGTDSVVPDGAQWALNTLNRGAYPWPDTKELQTQQIANMRAHRLPTISLFYHGTRQLADGRHVSEFSGTYHDVANNGINLPRTEVYFDCNAPVGRQYLTADEPPPADTTPAAGAGAGGDTTSASAGGN